MIIDYKIDQILALRDTTLQKYSARYIASLELEGRVDATMGIYIEMLTYTLNLTSLGDVTRLELYKKLLEILRKNGLIGRLPEPDPVVLGYPYYYGVGDPGANVATIQAMTAVISAREDKSFTFSPTAQVYYFAYPSTYGSLNSILDNNGFETLSGWTQRTETFVEDTDNVSYYVYEFNNITTQVGFINSFKY